MARRRPVGRRGLPVVTSEGCSYSGTWSWVKLVSVPESPPLGLYDTVPVQLYWQLHVKCCALLMFHCTEVVYLGVAAWERSVGRPSRNRLENGHANHHRYRITTPVRKMHLDRAATRISTYSVLAGRRWPPARQSQCRSRVARRACASSLRPTRYHRCGTADTPCRPKLNAIRRPGCTS